MLLPKSQSRELARRHVGQTKCAASGICVRARASGWLLRIETLRRQRQEGRGRSVSMVPLGGASVTVKFRHIVRTVGVMVVAFFHAENPAKCGSAIAGAVL